MRQDLASPFVLQEESMDIKEREEVTIASGRVIIKGSRGVYFHYAGQLLQALR
jgi:hypothetical protein